MSLPFTPSFRFVTGPLEGCLADDNGLWMDFHGVATYEDADDDMRSRFEDWCKQKGKEPNEDIWEHWLNSWESEPIEEDEN